MKFPILTFLMLLVLAGCQDAANETGSDSSIDDGTAAGGTFAASGQQESGAVVLEPASDILAPGSPAAAVKLTAVVHGAPFESLQNGKVNVIEFWATWCGPCLQSMPHMSDLQERYQGKVQFVGVTDEDVDTVTEFLARERGDETWADVLRYTIAVDEERTTGRDYMGAAQQDGIPCAFIVNTEGNIAWIGHPLDIDEPLLAVVEGTWNLSKARTEFLATMASPEPPEQPVVLANPLEPGMDAPAVQVASIVQGAPVEGFQDGKAYVVEFWATWCGPCLQSMPHISSLQEEYGDSVQFIGVTREDAETVSEFMALDAPSGDTWQDVLQYSIALDDDSSTWENYMTAAGQGGIPCAFIVNQEGQVAWIGHPMQIDKPLASVVDGSFDIATATQRFQIEKELQPALRRGDLNQVLSILDQLLETEPTGMQHGLMKLQVLGITEKPGQMLAFASELLETHSENSKMQDAIAWLLANQEEASPEALDMALQAAASAASLTEEADGGVLETLARVHYVRGDVAQAVSWQEKAVATTPTAPQLQETLDEYKAELDTGKPAAEPESDSATESDAE